MTPLLEVAGVSKRFGGVQAVRGLNLAVHDGEILGLIGPNGAGKSTVFNLINGVYPPDRGRIAFKGEDITGKPPYRIARHGIARAHQIVQPLAGMTVLENCTVGACFGRENLPLARAQDVVREAAEIVGLADRLDQPAGQLTTAGKKRLELARALSARPELLLLDEVLAGLNPTEIERMIAVIRRIRDRGIAILIIEHVMRAIMRLSDRIVVLNLGGKLAEGTPRSVANNPEVIAAYLGAPEPAVKARSLEMSEPLLRVEALEAGYDEVQVLWGISLGAAPGTTTTLVGANGAGKTTSLRAITGNIQPFGGRVFFAGEDVTQLAPHAKAERGLVLVPEGRQLFDTMSVQDNLEMGAFSKRARRRFAERLDHIYTLFPRLKERARQKAGTLSGGEQQMLAIARGLMSDPEVLIIDELSLGLAPVVVQQLASTLRALKESGMTILLVEQNVQLALALSDYAYVIAEGRAFAEGSSAEVARKPEIRQAYLGL
ncbi:MAG TPA: ATP-binding cassette domain-containing protein [Methyloceanibacter sp.]|nr:ATP-binding cassette domain-containing protein [Methyloceanibacter sp.]